MDFKILFEMTDWRLVNNTDKGMGNCIFATLPSKDDNNQLDDRFHLS